MLLLGICWTVQATTYYIDPTGADGVSRNGSISQPWLHLSYACTRATTIGDIIHVNSGTYFESSQCNLALGVSIEGVGATSIISSSYTSEAGTINLSSTSQGTNGNQSISYLKMDGNSLTSHIAIEVNARSNVKIHHCEIINFLSWGVIFNGLPSYGASAPSIYATGNEFYNNIVTNCAGYGGGYGHGNLAVGGQLGLLVHDNIITQTSRGGAGSHGWCYKYYSEGYNKGVKIYNNKFVKPPYNGDWDFAMEFCMWEQGGCEIYNNIIEGAIDLGARRKGNYAYSVWIHNNIIGKATRTNVREAGIIFENVMEDAIVENNYFKNISHGIGIHGGDVGDHATNMYIRYNIFDQMGNSSESWGMYWYAGSGNGVENNLYFENNVFTSYAGSPMGIGLAMPPTEHATNVYVRNNIFVGFSYAYISAYGSGTMDHLYLQNNILYQNGNSNNPLWESPYSPTNVTNTGNLKVNPLFLSANSDWHLQAGSPGIDAGIGIGLNLDYDGNAVPFNVTPDIGAYEYGSSPPPTSIPVYVSSAIENPTPGILEMTYSLSLANIVPAPSAFLVLVNATTRTVNSVTISGTKALLTLASPVNYGDVVTVSYTKPVTNPLQTVSGGEASSITSQSVTNNRASTIPIYVSASVENATPSIIEMSYSLALANILPSTSAFNVVVNSVIRGINSVTIVSGKVRLALSSPVVYGDIITVSYTKPGTNPLQTATGGLAASMAAQSVTNNCLTPIPVYQSSVVENGTPNILDITYNLNLANVVPATSAFTVLVNSVARSVNSVIITGGKVRLALVSPVVYGDIISVSYTKPGSNPLQTSSGGVAGSISAQTVTNNCISPIPLYQSSVIENATPTILKITFSLNLANNVPETSAFTVFVNSVERSISSVAITGGKVWLTLDSPVVYGDIIAVAYTKPANNALQNILGIEAASFSVQTVTNGCISPIPAYQSSVIENSTPTILEMTYSLDLANVVPATSAFNVIVNSVESSISSVTITDGKVWLILSTPVVYGDIITVAYTKPDNYSLQTALAREASSISAQSVTNNCISPVPVFQSSVIENTTPYILEITFSLSLANIVPETSAFNVVVNSVERSISSVTIIDGKVRLALSNYVVYGDIIKVAYTKPGSNALQTVSGGDANSFTDFPVTNNVELNNTPPVLIVNIYPNPANEYLNLSIEESPVYGPLFIKIIDLSGQVCFDGVLDSTIDFINIPINLETGMYIVQIGSGALTMYSQKLIVYK
jgi:uncharacterized repeat protein (TIGR02059 family)